MLYYMYVSRGKIRTGMPTLEATEQAEEFVDAVTLEEEDFPIRGKLPPDKIAWLIVLGAFALFCTVSLASIFAAYTYLFQSSVSVPAILQVAKGTVGITGSDLIETVERGSKDLTNTVTSISTDSLSQATMQFRDQHGSAKLLAAVTLAGDTFVTFNFANRPRFEWSANPQHVQFSRLQGGLDILVTGVGDRAFLMDIYTADPNTDGGLHVHILSNGRYRVQASEDEIRLLNLDGMAQVFFRDEAARQRLVRAGEELIARVGNRSMSNEFDTDSALNNAIFSLLDWRDTANELPGWECSVTQVQAPAGNYSLEEIDGRVALRLRRVNNAQSNGVVRCRQTFVGGLDVSAFDSLRVLATLRANYQSLSVCGRAASECPLMLRIDFEDNRGRDAAWLRGFYYADDISGTARMRCDSCIQDHIDMNQGVWYTFDSDNLFNLLAEADHPRRIHSVTFYASGHQFDTAISEMLLLLGSATAA